MRTRFEGLARTRIALEVGGRSAWVSELLGELGHEVLVANARKLRMIFQSDSKNDRLDAEQLARVARMDSKLLYPIEHRNRSARADLAVMRSRDALVAMRTRPAAGGAETPALAGVGDQGIPAGLSTAMSTDLGGSC